MLRIRCLISVILVLSHIWLISDIYAQAPKSYRREFPASVSPKPEIIQERDSRIKMETEVIAESEQKQQLQQLEKLQKEELARTREEELKKVEGLIEEADRLYSEGKYEEAIRLYDEARKLAEKKPGIGGSKPSQIYYQISIGDRLYIWVWRISDLSLEFIVGPDGYISFPLVGDTYAYGRTLSELDAEITEKLREYVNDPQVSVMVREFAGDNVTVIGEVPRPGVYKFIRKTNIIDALALAGGFTDRAKVAAVAIIREPEALYEDPELIVVNAKSILKGQLRNIEVKPNDIVYVSRTFVSNLHEFYNNWVGPVLGTVATTAIDFETYMSVRKTRRQ